MDIKNKVIAIPGPTGVGKTELSIKLALLINAEIISCDSMQVYKGMDIGTAKATKKERETVKHHLIDIKSPKEKYSVSDFVKDAKNEANDIFSRGKNVIITGGTGLYMDSFIKDTKFSQNSSSDDEIRKRLQDEYEKNGAEYLHKILEKKDPESALNIHPNNVKRVIRAIEYYEKSGEKISEHNKKSALKKSPYDYLYIGLTRDRQELYERIEKRVDIMIENGLTDEVKSLWKDRCNLKMTSMQALGYKEIIHYIEGRLSFSEAVRILKRDSKRYAKRQMTWFNRNKEINWINLSYITLDKAIEKCIELIQTKF